MKKNASGPEPNESTPQKSEPPQKKEKFFWDGDGEFFEGEWEEEVEDDLLEEGEF